APTSFLYLPRVCRTHVPVSLLMPRLPAMPPLFPYTTLFRSAVLAIDAPPPENAPPRLKQGGALWKRQAPQTPRGGPRVASDFRQDRKSTTSELQSLTNLVCRLLLEKKKHSTRARSVHNT